VGRYTLPRRAGPFPPGETTDEADDPVHCSSLRSEHVLLPGPENDKPFAGL